MARSARFFSGFPWRFVVTTLDGETVTSLERLAGNRTVTFRLNQPATTAGRVPSDDPRVNITDVEVGLDAPHLSFSDRLMYGFRREAVNPSQWVCRFAGIVAQIEDQAQADQPYSSYTAYDPWQYMFHRRVLDGTNDVGPDGLFYTGPGSLIVEDLLANALADGEMFVEWDPDTWEVTADIEITFQQGTSLGDALRQLVQTGTLDIVFTPVYDPIAKPGVCCRIDVYTQAGTTQYGAPFLWDTGRSVSGITSLLDGDQLANDIRFHAGQGGTLAEPQPDGPSQARYGIYTAQQFFPGRSSAADVLAVETLARFQLGLRKQGRRSLTISPNPLLAPKPFIDYGLGDRVPVHATRRLRQEIPWDTDATVYQRVYGIPIVLGDDGVERVDRLVASPDGFS